MTADAAARPSVSLDSPLSAAVGERSAAALRKAFGHVTVGDLLAHYPRRYAHRAELTDLEKLPVDEEVTIVAEVLHSSERKMQQRRGSIVETVISDGKGRLTLTFFNQSWRVGQLTPGARGVFAGKISRYKGALQLAHPEFQLFSEADAERVDLPGIEALPDPEAWAKRPIPIYPATGSLPSWKIQAAIDETLRALGDVDDPVPVAIVREKHLLAFGAALRGIHQPSEDDDWTRARDSLRYQEAFVLQAALLQRRESLRTMPATPREHKPGGYLDAFDVALPFALTADQGAVGGAIESDLARHDPMNRLVQGEVGSGKTVVALRGMLQVADSGGQSAFLAPTEVLAAQHLRSIARVLGPDLSARLMPTLITGGLPTAERKKALLRTVTGQASIVVGTHALLSETVSFFDLGMVVVDEQHRFGVDQREALRAKGSTPPHLLVLTATPIPRTVAMTVFGDLDVSTIAELPGGRAAIESFVAPLAEHPRWEQRVWERASEEIEKGHQVFVVCPAISAREIEEGETDADAGDDSAPRTPPASVEQTEAAVKANPLFASKRIATLHGRMSSDEKDAVMTAFAAGTIDLLIATTVIEVGVDVPNASTMIVLDADRFGVSQLHQLRGRVGRGSVAGLCLFVTRAEEGTFARERVDVVAATLDGFELAQADLELRREGDVLGSNQSGGRSSLRLLRAARDGEVIAQARADAASVLEMDPELGGHPALAEAIGRRLTAESREFLAKS